MGAVFREQKEPGNREKSIEYPVRSGQVLCFVLIQHDTLLFRNLFLRCALMPLVWLSAMPGEMLINASPVQPESKAEREFLQRNAAEQNTRKSG